MSAFLAQGGYAAFIWPAYGASVVGILCAVWLVVSQYRAARARLALLEKPKP